MQQARAPQCGTTDSPESQVEEDALRPSVPSSSKGKISAGIIMNHPVGFEWLRASLRPGQCFSDPDNSRPDVTEPPPTPGSCLPSSYLPANDVTSRHHPDAHLGARTMESIETKVTGAFWAHTGRMPYLGPESAELLTLGGRLRL